MKHAFITLIAVVAVGCSPESESRFFTDVLEADRSRAISTFGIPTDARELTGDGELLDWDSDTLHVQCRLQDGKITRVVIAPKERAQAAEVLNRVQSSLGQSQDWRRERKKILGEERDALVRDDSRVTIFESDAVVYIYGRDLSF